MSRQEGEPGTKLVAQNRKARHEYLIEDTYEAGIVLTGTEVKSCRAGKVSLVDAYAVIKEGEAWLMACHIAPYSHGNRANHDPLRERKLLLRRDEIARLTIKVNEQGRTVIPLKMYFKHGLAKIQLAVARGKKTYDKRHAIAKRDVERDMQRQLGRRR